MRHLLIVLILSISLLKATPVYFAYLWHMHQPIYYPGETIVETETAGHYEYSVIGIHTDRTGPYTSWVRDAIEAGMDAGLGQLGASVSFSGSLIENLNVLEANGTEAFTNWTNDWIWSLAQTTTQGNPRLDLVRFGYFHPLMALIDQTSISEQIISHGDLASPIFQIATHSRGIFPPENAFMLQMIPALVENEIDWVLVDNIHFERATQGYPYSTGSNLVVPNPAEQLNPDPGDWQQLNGLWCPSAISAQWAHQPHYAAYVDPSTGLESRVVVVPASRYIGTEDARGGYGALQYETVFSQLEAANTDPDHPILVVMAHDGDNHGGGTYSYYHNNFQQMVAWLSANSERFVCTTIQDYLDQFLPDPDDVIHVEPGSWSGADNGDPEFKKWNADPHGGYSPDQNSWAVMTAANNLVRQAEGVSPSDPALETARRYLHMGQGSDYWYWDWSQGGIWDTHPTRAANLAITSIQHLLGNAPEVQPPSLYLPQREPYNPGGMEWDNPQSSDFQVWTLVYDWTGLDSVWLYVREDQDGFNDPQTIDNETFSGGPDAGEWLGIEMSATVLEPQTNVDPLVIADLYTAQVEGFENVLLDYYVRAVDPWGNAATSIIQHVYVGDLGGGGPDGYVMDGILDDAADLVLESDELFLYAHTDGEQVYLAANSAAEIDEDVFIVVANQPGPMVPAFWAKAGQVSLWEAYLGNESTNSWSGWFDTQQGIDNATGEVLEGIYQLNDPPPDNLYLAMVTYETQDGGELLRQLPVGNDDINLDAAEYLAWPIDVITGLSSHQPHSFEISIYPNPGNFQQIIQVRTIQEDVLRISLYNILGQQVMAWDEELPAGEHHLKLRSAKPLSSGVYLLRVEGRDTNQLSKLIRMN